MTPPKKKPSPKKASRPPNSKAKNRAKTSAPEPAPEPEMNPQNGQPFAPEFVAARFQPGSSGNPKGRRKGQKSLKSVLLDLLDEPLLDPETREPVEHREAEGDGTMSKLEALGRMLMEGALRPRPDRQMLDMVVSQIMPKPMVIDATIETTNPKLREAVGSLDADGREALRLALGQLGAKSPLDDEPASPDDPLH